MESSAKAWIRQRKTGCVLYTSPSPKTREGSITSLAKYAVCSWTAEPSCDCADCSSVIVGNHPSVIRVTPDNFDEVMAAIYSLPAPVVLFPEAHRVSKNRQSRLLIWLEAFGRDRLVVMTADTEYSLLPTIRSRSVVFTEIPKPYLSEEDKFKGQAFLQTLWSGKAKFEDIMSTEDSRAMARILQMLLITEMENRYRVPARKMIAGSDQELMTLLKVLERYFQDSSAHSLRLLMSGFSMHVLQSTR